MFYTPKYENFTKELFCFSEKTDVIIPDSETSAYIKKTLLASFARARLGSCESIQTVEFTAGIPENLKKEVSADGNEEEFIIEFAKHTHVYTNSEKAFILALSSILDIANRENAINGGVIYDKPAMKVRGYRAFIPGGDQINDFINTLDFLVRYRFTSIMLEIGGAMEYERHPEINEAWIEYCKDIKRYSGRSHEVQSGTYPWRKNSIHSDNGNGSYLTKQECRKIAAACRERGIEIVPECPTLSHCDYIVMAHPEIRERQNDYHADTYCPSAPDTYKIVFDILDEVIEVFEPKSINIGHDEFYSVGICDRCKDKEAWRIFADDVIKISDYLRSKGVRTMMWGDKVINAILNGTPHGGAEIHSTCLGTPVTIPATYPSIDYLPKDTTFIHWYWSYGYDNEYLNRGYPLVYGNLNQLWWHLYNWPKMATGGSLGGYTSNWGSTADEYMQRNCMYAEIIACGYSFYTPTYNSETEKKALTDKVMRELFLYKRELKRESKLIPIIHTANIRIPYIRCVDGIFIEDKKYLLGKYKVTYSDNSSVELPVKFGTNIGYIGLDKNEVIDVNEGGLVIGEYVQLSGSTYPIAYNGRIYYLTEYVDPNPEKQIISVEYLPIIDTANVIFKKVNYINEPAEYAASATDMGGFECVREYTTEQWGRDRDMFLDE